MTNYIKITSDGQCRDLSNQYDGIHFSGYRTDTTFRISDSLMTVLNNFFTAGNQLSNHIKKKSVGGHFAGPYQYIYFKTKNNITDSSVSTGTNNDSELAAIFNAIWHLPYPKTTYTGKIYRDKGLEDKIAVYHKKVKDLPKALSPPSVNGLKHSN